MTSAVQKLFDPGKRLLPAPGIFFNPTETDSCGPADQLECCASSRTNIYRGPCPCCDDKNYALKDPGPSPKMKEEKKEVKNEKKMLTNNSVDKRLDGMLELSCMVQQKFDDGKTDLPSAVKNETVFQGMLKKRGSTASANRRSFHSSVAWIRTTMSPVTAS